MTCTCCLCAGLPLTRGFGGTAGPFYPGDTKLVTWADGVTGPLHVVVDGNGPIGMEGQPGWVFYGAYGLQEYVDYAAAYVFAGSSVTFTQLDGPSCSVGTRSLPHLRQTNDPADITSTSGAASVSLYGQTASIAYTLTLDALPASISNAVFVDKSDEFDPPFESSAAVWKQWPSTTMVTIQVGFTGTDRGYVPSVLDLETSSTGTSLEEFTERRLDGLKNLLCWREVFTGTAFNQPKWNVQSVQAGGEPEYPPITSGYTLANALQFAGQSRLLLTAGSEPLTDFPIPISLSCVASGQHDDELPPTAGFWTATAFRPAHLNRALDTAMDYSVTGPTGVGMPYCKGHVTAMVRRNTGYQNATTGCLFALSRNGTETMAPTQSPTAEQLYDATNDEGSYLVTVTPTGSYGYQNTPLPTNKDFFSFVIDRKPPVVGFAPLDDIFVRGDGTPGEEPPGTSVVTSTKPLQYPSCPDEESPTGVLARPCRNVALKQGAADADELSTAAGTYTLQPFSLTQCIDFAGNHPVFQCTQSWTVHAKHANYRKEVLPGGHSYYGAIPKLETPGLQTREYHRARLQSERIASLTLTFDRPIDTETVDDSQITLLANGETVEGCTIEQTDATSRNWKINIPLGAQASATFLQLEYDPAGEVMTAETFPELHYPTKADFITTPSRLAELFRHVFVSDDDGKRYSVSTPDNGSTVEYVEIAGNPLDWNGNPYDPEPSAIVARASWVMSDTAGWPRLIDTSSVVRGVVIGRAASIGASGAIDMQENDLAIACTGDIGIAKESAPANINFGGVSVPPPVLPQEPFTDFGLVASAVNYEWFIPRVPTTGVTGPFSYWGLGTTIDPAPPALVPPCASPSESQWHSSAIACDSEITQFTARIVALDEYGNETAPPNDSDGYYMNGKVVFGSQGGGGMWIGPAPGDFNHVAADLFPRIMCLGNPPAVGFGTLFQGQTLAQNLWACKSDGGGTEVKAMPMSVRAAYFIDGETVTTSPYWIAENPYFKIQFTTEERTFGDIGTTLEEAQAALRFTTDDLVPVGTNAFAGVIRSVTDATYSVDGIHAVLSACRQAKTFLILKTTTLGPLILSCSFRACIKAETTYEDCAPDPSQYVYVDADRPLVDFEERIDEIMASSPYYDADAGTWKLPPCPIVMYATCGSSLASRTIVERVLKDYVYTHTLTPDQEVALAAGQEIAMPFVGGQTYSVKIKRV